MIQLCVSPYSKANFLSCRSESAELLLAQSLANNISSLSVNYPPRCVACTRIVGDIASDLVELFGPTAGGVEIVMAIEPVYLPSLKRRALALLVTELVANALIHAFASSQHNRIQVTLRGSRSGIATLYVEDNGIGFAQEELNETGVGASLAALLQGRLMVSRTAARTTSIGLDFPRIEE
jgi:two-component sensor histidine kinase